MRSKRSITVLLGLVLAVGLSFQTAGAEDWPMFHHDVALSGYTSDYAPGFANVLWTYQTDGVVESSPAVVGDKVYVGSRDGNLYCLDKYTGALLWSYPTGDAQSSPAVAEGTVYILSETGTFYALDALSGTELWNVDIGNGSWDWSSPAVHDGNVFIASSTGYLYSLDAVAGTENWAAYIGGTPDSPISVVNGVVYSGTHNFDNLDSTLVAVDEATGAVLWTYEYHLYHSSVTGMVDSNGATVVDGDEDGDLEIYFGVYNWNGVDDQAVCLDEASGAEVWTQSLGENTTSTPAVHDGKVFIGSDDGNLYALDAANGDVLCSYQTGDSVLSSPAVSGDGQVCFGSTDHTVYCIEEDSCELVWSYYTGTSRLRSSPAISEGILYIGNENGNVYAFGALPAEIDIKPWSDPNCFNNNGRGVIPVAVFGSDLFECSDIDPATVSLEGMPVKEAGNNNVLLAHCDDLNGDGYTDLVVQIQDVEGTFESGSGTASLTGSLYDGRLFEGSDSICVVPVRRGFLRHGHQNRFPTFPPRR